MSGRPQIYRFLDYELDAPRLILKQNGELVRVAPKVVETLLVLVRHGGEVVDKQTLFTEVWPGTFVVESSLTRNISILRKALKCGAEDEAVIQTVFKRGYRFLPSVTAEVEGHEASSATPDSGIRWRYFLPAGGVAIAVAIVVLSTLLLSQRTPQSPPDGCPPAVSRRPPLLAESRACASGKALVRFERATQLDPRSALAQSRH